MPDFIDDANDIAERALAASLAAQRAKPRKMLHPKGECYSCEAEFPQDKDENGEFIDNRIFCDKDCAQDFEYKESILRNQGLLK